MFTCDHITNCVPLLQNLTATQMVPRFKYEFDMIMNMNSTNDLHRYSI